MTLKESAIKISKAWRQRCAPDLDDRALGFLDEYITGVLIKERERAGAVVRAAVSAASDRDFAWGEKLLNDIRFPKESS